VKISICIPTYNRAVHLQNCLHSINIAAESLNKNAEIEVCISNNGSTDNTEWVVKNFHLILPLKYHHNATNIGIPRNFINVVEMASGEFIWLVGDDDLLVPDALVRLSKLIEMHAEVDFFYVNAFHQTTEYVLSQPQPFDTNKLPVNMAPFSDRWQEGKLPFLDLIDPGVSFDFLGGMFLSVFRREKWKVNVHKLDKAAIADMRTFSHIDNTFPHVKIFAHAFSMSAAYFNSKPMIVCLTGAREWAPMQPMIMTVRMIEVLELYRKVGLKLTNYLKCRNYALKGFLPHLAWMYWHSETSGLQYVRIDRSMLSNLLYPNFYLSPFYYFLRKFNVWIKRYIGSLVA
jgi:glycosyltransferase involved in cell wall biosynthesis